MSSRFDMCMCMVLAASELATSRRVLRIIVFFFMAETAFFSAEKTDFVQNQVVTREQHPGAVTRETHTRCCVEGRG